MIKVKLNTAAKIQGDAYMLRRDGEEIWVDVHPYGVITKQSNARECNLLPAVFLARYSRENKSEAIQFINSYLAEVVMNADEKYKTFPSRGVKICELSSLILTYCLNGFLL